MNAHPSELMKRANEAHRKLAALKPNAALQEVSELIVRELRTVFIELSKLRTEIAVISSMVKPSEISQETRTMVEIVHAVLQDYPGVTLEMVRGARSNREVHEARAECWFQVRFLRPDISFPVMGRFFRRDHSSILRTVRIVGAKRGVLI